MSSSSSHSDSSSLPAAASASSSAGAPYPGSSAVPPVPISEDSSAMSDSNPPAPVGECPLGFSSRSRNPLGPLSCPFCKVLYYQSTAIVPCGHSLCATCLSQFTLCPICGVDIESTEPNLRIQDMVDVYLNTHAHKHALGPDGVYGAVIDSSNGKEDGLSPALKDKRAKAMFLNSIAMRALIGRNPISAAVRMEHARDLLRSVITEDSILSSSELLSSIRCELAVVCGKLGDIQLAMNRPEDGLVSYKESCHVLAAPAEQLKQAFDEKDNTVYEHILSAGGVPDNDDVAYTLSVSINKLGDFLFSTSDLSSAQKQYEYSLKLRRIISERSSSSAPIVLTQRKIDHAVAAGKVADVLAASGQVPEAIKYVQEALDISLPLQTARKDAIDAAMMSKLNNYIKFFESMKQTLTSTAEKKEEASSA